MTNAPAPEVTITPDQEALLQLLMGVNHRSLGPMVDTLRAAMLEDPYVASRFCAYLLTVPNATAINDHREAAAIALLGASTSDGQALANYREAGRVGLLGNSVYPKTAPAKLSGLDPYQILRVERFMRGEYKIMLGTLEVERVPAWDLTARYVAPVRPAKLETETNSAWHRRIKAVKQAFLARETPAERKARSQYQYLKRWAARLTKARTKDSGHWSFQAKHQRTQLALPVELTVEHFRVEQVANFHRPTRLMKAVMRDYLKMLEAAPKRFDSVLNLNKAALVEAYSANYVPRSARAQAILFDNVPPEDSLAAVVKKIAAEADPQARARLVMEHDIPYTVAASLLPKSPDAWIALISVMTPNQARNARRWVVDSGILNIPEVRAVFEALLEKASGSAASIYGRKSAQSTDEGTQAALDRAAEKSVAKSKRRIAKRTVILVDISGSMEETIAYAAQLAGYLAPYINPASLLVAGFNSGTFRVESATPTLAGWKAAMAELKAKGTTDIEQAVRWVAARQFAPEEIIFVTDGGENAGSRAAQSVQIHFPRVPVTIFGMGAWNPATINGRRNEATWHRSFAESFKAVGVEARVFLPQSVTDYNIFDQAISTLGGPSLMQTILDTPLPKRLLA